MNQPTEQADDKNFQDVAVVAFDNLINLFKLFTIRGSQASSLLVVIQSASPNK